MYTILENESNLQQIAIAKIKERSETFNKEETVATALPLIPLKMELKTGSQNLAFITHSSPSKELLEYIRDNPDRTNFFNIGNIYQKNNKRFVEILTRISCSNGFLLNLCFIVPIEECIFHYCFGEAHYLLEGKNEEDMSRLLKDKDFFTFCEN